MGNPPSVGMAGGGAGAGQTALCDMTANFTLLSFCSPSHDHAQASV